MLGHTSQKITETVYAKHQPEFLKDIATTLDSLFGVPVSPKGMLVAPTRTILRAKCAPAIDHAREFIWEDTTRKAA